MMAQSAPTLISSEPLVNLFPQNLTTLASWHLNSPGGICRHTHAELKYNNKILYLKKEVHLLGIKQILCKALETVQFTPATTVGRKSRQLYTPLSDRYGQVLIYFAN